MSAESASPLPGFTGVYSFGDSLLDPGNDLRAAELLDRFPFVSVPDGAPTADKGYFEGRFSNGYNFADLISNKLLDQPAKPTFPYGVAETLLGFPSPIGNRPEGNNLSFAYGGARVIQGPDPAPALGAQVEIYETYTADPNALYVVGIGANDVLSLVPTGGAPVTGAEAEARLAAIASEIVEQVSRLYSRGARHVVIADIPNVGAVPAYQGSQDEAMRRGLAAQYAHRVDDLLEAQLGALARPTGSSLLQFHFDAYTDAAVADPARYGFTNVTQALTSQGGALDPTGRGFLFFDNLHPTAQTHAQVASEILDGVKNPGGPLDWNAPPTIGSQAVGAIPAGGADRFVAALNGGETYVLDLVGVSSGAATLADPLVRVLDASGAVVAEDDDGGLGLDAHLQFAAPAAGDYLVEVQGVGVTSGSYRLQIAGPGGSNLLLSGRLRGSDVAVEGGAQGDAIVVLGGANYLRGGDGNDTITGGTGFDNVNGNKGDDSLVGVSAIGDWLLGGQGNDLIDAALSSGGNRVNGNLGADTLTGGSGGDSLRGGQGADRITAGPGADWLSGDLGDDTLAGGDGADTFHAGGGLDLIVDFDLAQQDRVQLDAGMSYSLSQAGSDTLLAFDGGAQMRLVGFQTASPPDTWILGG
ncbi:SGNH/GDSL hydrolase family protein [Phenylobacterium sp. LjRoot225]|uniref:SGNH/GDSL hydrolase family protein n=1 Tax=Phenylobacterium sp. LjRoot225 TaxID=3342285 RepID=UPI003ECE266F